jgi:hypothetical protein
MFIICTDKENDGDVMVPIHNIAYIRECDLDETEISFKRRAGGYGFVIVKESVATIYEQILDAREQQTKGA